MELASHSQHNTLTSSAWRAATLLIWWCARPVSFTERTLKVHGPSVKFSRLPKSYELCRTASATTRPPEYRRNGSRAVQPRRIHYQARGLGACYRYQRLAAAAQELQRLYVDKSRWSFKMFKLTRKLQCSFAHRTTLPFLKDARPLHVILSSTFRLVLSTLTSPPTLRPTKLCHGLSACFGMHYNSRDFPIKRLMQLQR